MNRTVHLSPAYQSAWPESIGVTNGKQPDDVADGEQPGEEVYRVRRPVERDPVQHLVAELACIRLEEVQVLVEVGLQAQLGVDAVDFPEAADDVRALVGPGAEVAVRDRARVLDTELDLKDNFAYISLITL